MKKEHRKFSASFNAKVALDAIKEQQKLQELAVKHGLHPTQINAFKKEFLEKADSVFTSESKQDQDEGKEKELYSKIKELQVQVDFLKKV